MLSLITSVTSVANSHKLSRETPKPVTGNWRGEFELRPGVMVPFNFEIIARGSKQLVLFRNGDEVFEGGVADVKNDSIFIALDQFDNILAFKLGDKEMAGTLRKIDGSGLPYKVKVQKDLTNRFSEPKSKPAKDISGTYDIVFNAADGSTEKGVGVLEQSGSKIKGTFLRNTGDSRYMEGIVDGSKFQLSSFIGSSPSYYRGSIESNGKISGEIVGVKSSLPFTGTMNEDAKLDDPYKLTFLKTGYERFDFSFPDREGKMVSLDDERFKDKAVVITISGSWCPNCMDETNFLVPWYNKNKNRGVEVVAIHYERQTDSAYVRKTLERYRERFGVTYQQVFGGKADKTAVAASLPSLNGFLSYPTTIIVDRKGKVVKIHTGFSGPATGKFYDEFVRDFNNAVDQALAN
jgi:thiol-disulfide isomerase/thioredoxin